MAMTEEKKLEAIENFTMYNVNVTPITNCKIARMHASLVTHRIRVAPSKRYMNGEKAKHEVS